MMKPFAIAVVFSMLGEPLRAQSLPSGSETTSAESGTEFAAEADRTPPVLPVSLDRIKRELAIAYTRPTDPLRLHYYVEVYGKMQRLDLLADEDLRSGAVPYGGPTHRDILYQITPEEFRSPPADIGALGALIAQWLSRKKSDK
jgi:hypothetical protein